MSGISIGKTPEMAALEILTALADPETHKRRLLEVKAEQDRANAAAAEARATHDKIVAHRKAADEALTSAQKLNADTEDRRAEIARRQGEWEMNLNARQAELNKIDGENAKRSSALDARKSELDKREAAIASSEKDIAKQKGVLDKFRSDLTRLQSELNAKAQAISDLGKTIGR